MCVDHMMCRERTSAGITFVVLNNFWTYCISLKVERMFQTEDTAIN